MTEPAITSPTHETNNITCAVSKIIQLYEALTPDQLDLLANCYAKDAHFKDPFNDVSGRDNIRRIFAHMFTSLNEPRFKVTEQLIQGQKAFLEWEFRFSLQRWRTEQIQYIRGATLMRFNTQGLVMDHRDYWDTAEEFYEKLPVLGVLMRWLRRSGSATTQPT